MKKFLLAGLLSAVAAPLAAQAPLPDADPAMWVAKDEDTTVYLFGTFHMLDGKQDWFNDEVKTAFDASQEVVVEAIIPEDPAALQPLIMKHALDMSGKKLSDKLTPHVKTQLDAMLTKAGIPAEARQGFDMMKPWFVSTVVTSIATDKMGLKPEHGADKILTTAAKAKNLKIGELEGVEWQLGMFDALPEAQQVAMLSDSITEFDKIETMFKPMLAAWSSGNTEGLAEIMNEDDDPALYKLIFTDRNAKWAEWIDTRMEQPGTVFIAVGAGHLAGKGSVQDFLAQKGIKSERVTQ